MICSALPPLSTGDARYEFLGFFGPMSFPCTSRRSPQATAPVFAGILVLLWLRALRLSPRFMRLRRRSQGQGKTRRVTS
ncbi:hypothetical protein SLEP1_g54983 [Rubroshorea leprosula]|uniref:Uncharacterized protein n=1 Tax=Rubroshorea leprosula TaxID=152421 RepID=A0AAV5MEC9_9ROSI|nr:hypothetical protein SLEP1_g54983 [Rubroshorea leprosula]